MATIIAVVGKASSGKTTLIKEAYKHFKGIPPERGDIRPDDNTILTIKGKRVGFASIGDMEKEVSEAIKIFLKKKCDIIIIACRSRGGTQKVILRHTMNNTIYWIWKPQIKTPKKQRKSNSDALTHLVSLISKEC